MLKFLIALLTLAVVGMADAQDCQNIKRFVPPRSFVHRVTFQGADPLLDPSVEGKIADTAWKMPVSAGSVDRDIAAVTDELADRTRRTLQDEGYFSANVESSFEKVSDKPLRYDINVTIAPPVLQFRLGNLEIVNATSFPAAQLRELFPIQRGEIFSREKITDGLEAIRRFYQERGYINFIPVPEIHLVETTATANLTINVDEGRQFRVRSIDVIGVDDDTKSRILQEFSLHPGDVYTPQAWEDVRLNFPRLVDPENNVEKMKLSERDGLVDLILDLRRTPPCTSP